MVKEIERATFIQVNYYIAFVYYCTSYWNCFAEIVASSYIDQITVMSLQYARVEDMQEEKNIKKCIEKSIVEN